MKKYIVLAIISFLIIYSCKENTLYKERLNDPKLFRSAVKNLSDVIVYDIFSPPVASRVYLYPSIASYAIIQKEYPEKYNSLVGQVNGFTAIPDPDNKNVNMNLAALQAFTVVGKQLIFSEDKITAFQNKMYDSLRQEGLPEKVLIASKTYGNKVAQHVLKYADGDLYNQTRTYPKYTIKDGDKYWKPTPPDYMDGIEPHWNKIRTAVLDSAGQFPPIPPNKYDLTKGSPFQKQLEEVYDIGNSNNKEQVEIAKFWDCNPYVSHHKGHAMFATKKITPGGHWMGIVNIVTSKANNTFDETVCAYTNVSIALFDGFISAWDEKWRSLAVRPETLINEFMDEEWMPLLQTPPFPEYTSAHSVISASAAVALTKFYGDKFDFLDTTEMEYGLPARHFNSFMEASKEAAISRLYGGIHYRRACIAGIHQGENVGNFIMDHLKTLKSNYKMTDHELTSETKSK